MLRTRWLGLVGGLLLMSSGCCWWADKMCPQQHYGPPCAYYPAAPCTAAPQCTPYTPAWTPAPANYPTTAPVARPGPPCTCP